MISGVLEPVSAKSGYEKCPEEYKRITDDPAFGAVKDFLFNQYLRGHRNAEELIKRGESKTFEFKSTLRWDMKEDRKDDKLVTHAVLKTLAAFLNTDGGDLLIDDADDGSIVGIERDQLENDDKFMRCAGGEEWPRRPCRKLHRSEKRAIACRH